MRVTERQEKILELLKSDVFCTVERLAQVTYTSPSSIRRDLAYLQTQGLVRRTHGGVSLAESAAYAPALQNRLTKNVAEKRKLARLAARFLKDGISVMLDGSSTASFLLPHLAEHKNLRLFTNSMTTAMRAGELGIATTCIGGRSVRNGAVLAGEGACRAVEELYVDILFFSSQYLDEDGIISDSTPEENELRKVMLRHARQTVFLCDSSKFGKRTLYTLTGLDQISAAVFDCAFSELSCQNCCRIISG